MSGKKTWQSKLEVPKPWPNLHIFPIAPSATMIPPLPGEEFVTTPFSRNFFNRRGGRLATDWSIAPVSGNQPLGPS